MKVSIVVKYLQGTFEVKEIVMEQPQFGNVDKSSENIDAKFVKTNSDNKSIDIEAETFNWDEEEVKSPSKINIGQYEDENYEDDFEEEVKSNEEIPQKSNKNYSKKSCEKERLFTAEEENIIEKYEVSEEEAKMDTMKRQVKEINDLIEQATNICLK